MLSLWLHPDKEHSDAIKYFAFQQVQAFWGGQVPQLLKLKGKKMVHGGHTQPFAIKTFSERLRNNPKGMCEMLPTSPSSWGVNKDTLVPAKRRGASLSRAISGGSRSTVLSLSVTKPWYVGSSHGLCLLTVFKNRKRRKDIGQVRITIFNSTSFEDTHPLLKQ